MAAGKKLILYRSEMARIASESEFRKSKMVDRSEMARNASKVNFGRQPFVQKFKKKLKLRIDVKWIEMRSKVIFGHLKWPPAAIWSKIKKKSVLI